MNGVSTHVMDYNNTKVKFAVQAETYHILWLEEGRKYLLCWHCHRRVERTPEAIGTHMCRCKMNHLRKVRIFRPVRYGDNILNPQHPVEI